MSEKKNALLGFGGIFGGLGILVVILIAAGNPTGSDDRAIASPNPAPAAEISATIADGSSQSDLPTKTIADATEEEKRFITQNTPDMKQAADAVGLMINLSGYLCSEVFYVEPTDGGRFLVDCMKHKDRDIKARYVVDGATGTARPL